MQALLQVGNKSKQISRPKMGMGKKNPALVSNSDHHQGINQFVAAVDNHLSLGPEQIN